ncbi:MAG: glycoside hydrolase family 30 protein [Terracidiphilus sp.]|nr:glycoside hydrolase family 30 protein [Terracidiphilus sp.]
MKKPSRRQFVQQTVSALAALAAAKSTRLWAQGVVAAPLRGWVTSDQKRFDAFETPAWESPSGATSDSVQIFPNQRFQAILGFGGAFTDASCYLFSRMPAQQRRQLLEELLGHGGLNLSVGRTCIGSSDYSRTAYSYDDAATPDPELQHFSIDHDRAYILPTLRESLEVNPELFMFSAPWSPPGWMKSNGSLLGGAMRKHYFAAYAQYFVKFIEGYRAEGVKISAVTTQNEVDTDQDSRMPAALWGQEYEVGFIKEFLGPALRRAGLDTEIWLLDHNYDLWGRVLDSLSDPALAQMVSGVAWHGYMGTPDAMTRIHNAFPTKGTYWTEGGPDYTAPDYATDWAKWSSTCTGVLRNWARCIVAWNLVLDEKGKPNIGPFNCGGMVTLDSRTQQLTRSGQYWAFAHYSKAVRRGARVVASEGGPKGVGHVAFSNPDGSYVLVLTNPGEERPVECRCEERALRMALPRNSIVTLQWS